jgi:hypothetical protein
MADIEDALKQFGYLSLDDVTTEDLKRRFKTIARDVHPDKGGADDDFDSLLSGYMTLNRIMRRTAGGRDRMYGQIYVQDVKEERERQYIQEMNIAVSELFDYMDSTNEVQRDALERFNKAFEEQHVREDTHGYDDWLKNASVDDQALDVQWTGDFHENFVIRATKDKPAPTAIILHPEQMAMRPHFGGYDPSRINVYTADMDSCPEFTDLKEAYELEATVIDKVSPWSADTAKTFEQVLAERDLVYKTEEDRDLEMIAAYERAKEEEWKENERRIKAYYATTGSSVWALRNSSAAADDDGDEKYGDEVEQ